MKQYTIDLLTSRTRSTMFASWFVLLVGAALTGMLIGTLEGQKIEPKPAGVVHHKGHVPLTPEQYARLVEKAIKRHGHVYKRLPNVTAPAYDCRQLGIVPPTWNQKSCGSCWNFSGTRVANCALIKGHYGPADGSFTLSTQYTMDCYSNGGCNGDDNTTVLDHAKSVGLPTTADYGPYTASSGRCKSSSVKLYQIADWGFCDPNAGQSVSDTQLIKNSMVQFGVIGCSVAAGNTDFWNTGQGTCTGHSRSVDHDVVLVGWDDAHDNGDGSKGAWIMENSWGTGWGTEGFGWMKYGADSIGGESVWASATPLPPPIPPVPPVPPVPPPVPGAPVITSALTAHAMLGKAFAYQIDATNSPTVLDAIGLPVGLTCGSTGLITGTPTVLGQSAVTLVVANAAGATTAVLVLTVGPSVVPATITLTAEQVQQVLDAQAKAGMEPPLAKPKRPVKKRPKKWQSRVIE